MITYCLAALMVACVILPQVGCGSRFSNSYDREVDLTVRAALEKLSEKEKETLLRESHPILIQMADPALRGLLKLFAQLSDDQQAQLREKEFLKWRFTDLDEDRQTVFEQVLLMNMRLVDDQAVKSKREEVLELLKKCDVGFAVVQIPSSGERVISCYILWPEKIFPTWVTVANSKASLTQDSIAAHVTRLAMLRALRHSDLPPGGSRQPQETVESTATKGGNTARSNFFQVQPIRVQVL